MTLEEKVGHNDMEVNLYKGQPKQKSGIRVESVG